MTLYLLGWNALIVLALMTALWVVSIFLEDVSIVDPWWSIGFLLVAAHSVARTGLTPGKTLLLAMVATWSLRLWLHLLLRNRGEAAPGRGERGPMSGTNGERGETPRSPVSPERRARKPEDPRYAAFRRRFGPERYWWFSFFQVFLLQGALIVLISAPLQLAASATAPDPISWTDLAGLGVFLVGFALEAVADAQLEAFRRAGSRDSGARPPVLDTGLWRYSRHPNYFGEAVLWWGLWLTSLDVPLGWASALAPALMTFLLVKVSGVALLDAHRVARKPGYAEYIRKTSAFVPRPPRS